MALAYDTKNQGNTVVAGTPDTCTVALTIDATAKLIVVGIVTAINTAGRSGAPTWNTTETLTQVGSTVTGYKECQTEMWYLLSPVKTGAANIVVGCEGIVSGDIRVMASSYKGTTACVLDQSTSTNGGGAAIANPSLTLNNVPDGSVVVDILGDGYTSIPTANDGGTLLYSTDEGAWDTAGQYNITSIDCYNEANFDGNHQFNATLIAMGQTFTGQEVPLNYCKFWLLKTGTISGNAVAKLYAHTGTFGSTGVPTGEALATSDNFNVSSITTTASPITFTFSTPYTLVNGTKYCLVVEYSGSDATNKLQIADDVSTSTHPGNNISYGGSWAANNGYDTIFYACSNTNVSQTLSYTQSSDDVAMIMASFKESAPPPADVILKGVTYMES